MCTGDERKENWKWGKMLNNVSKKLKLIRRRGGEKENRWTAFPLLLSPAAAGARSAGYGPNKNSAEAPVWFKVCDKIL